MIVSRLDASSDDLLEPYRYRATICAPDGVIYVAGANYPSDLVTAMASLYAWDHAEDVVDRHGVVVGEVTAAGWTSKFRARHAL